PPAQGQYLDVYEPATGRVYTQAPASQAGDVDQAVAAARAAFPGWAATPINERARYLLAIADRIEARLAELAAAESRDNGKPVSLATAVDIPRAAANFRFFGHAITQFASEAHEMTGVAINYTLRQPLGVVGCISPWNLPLYLFTWKIAPALAAGNTVVAKPSEVTPYTAYLLSEICREVGLPAGVLNIIHGYGQDVGDAINRHPAIKAISFTGSTRTGAEIARVAAPMFKKLSLEMGGKNPNLIFADCDYDQALATTLRSSFANQGQICLCGSRIYVQRPIYERFRDDLVTRTRELKVGDPKDPETDLGAVVSQPHLEKILSYFELAREEGGRILCGGEQLPLSGELADGYYVAPTVIENLGPQCRVIQEEIFGPVVSIVPFDTEEEALALANGTDYGLSTTLWTENLSRAHRLATQLQAGIIWINTWMLRDLRTPFGGVKHSGIGREGGWEALRFFTEPKNVCVRWDGKG
ncbi:MAG: aldehyde dehydrogenase, partial [Lewinella sp.]|nr:aldehyde dehydrogenase [Lewinella sp.]